MDDTDLTGLDLDAAKEYIFAYAVDAKRLDKSIAEAQAEIDLWKARLGLVEGKLAGAIAANAASASDQSLTALAQAARAKVEGASEKLGALEAERAELRAKLARMREQLPMIKARERSIDPDRLLAELQMMTGELLGEEPGGRSAAATEADFAKLEAEAKADSDLEALKRRATMGAGDAARGGDGDGEKP